MWERTLSNDNLSRGDFSSFWNKNWPLLQSLQMELLLICQELRAPSPRSYHFHFSTFNMSKLHQLWIKVKGKLIFHLKVYSHETFPCIHGNVTTTTQPNFAPVSHQKIDNSIFFIKSTHGEPNLSRILWGSLKCSILHFLCSTCLSKELYISIEVEEGIQCLSQGSITVGLVFGWLTITQLSVQALQST